MEDQSQFLSDLLYLLSVAGIEDAYKIVTYMVPVALSWVVYKKIKRHRDLRSRETLNAAKESGLHEPPVSLHPIIDHNICLGCATCVTACPEGDVLGVIHEKAHLINPSHCIGHGACKTACPTSAISLVLGTEKRGIDIPTLNPNFETNVPGLFVAGELGGMGLIRNAIEQGHQALDSIQKATTESSSKAPYDVAIIGAGPAGFSASLAAHANKLRYVTVEQETLGGTVAHFPRGKIVMTAPVQLPIIGQVKFSETTKEKLIRFWEDVEQRTGVKINYQERMESIEKADDGFIVKTTKNTYHSKAILLSIGRRGTPRKLGVPGEEQEKVVYRLDDPAQYRGQHVLVVGGGNSALEAAMSIAEEPDTTVALSYRGNAFNNANPKNLTKLSDFAQENRLIVWMNSNVKHIDKHEVILDTSNGEIHLDNDAVIVCAGGVLPTPMLKSLGVEIETKHGTL